VATYARCGVILNNHNNANLLENLLVQKILKLVKISREFRVALPWELLYADDLAVIAETEGAD